MTETECQSSDGGPRKSIVCQFVLLTSTSLVPLSSIGFRQYSSREQLELQYLTDICSVRLAGRHTFFFFSMFHVSKAETVV